MELLFSSTLFPKDQPNQFTVDGNSSSRHAGNGGVYTLLYPHVHSSLQQQTGEGMCLKMKYKVLNLKYCSQKAKWKYENFLKKETLNYWKCHGL